MNGSGDRDDLVKDVLRRLAFGELSPSSPEARAAFERHAGLLERWEAFERNTARLDAAGGLAREVLLEDDQRVPSDWDDAVRAMLRSKGVLQQEPTQITTRRRPHRFAFLAAVATAAVLLLVLLPRGVVRLPSHGDDPVDRLPVYLGGDASLKPVLEARTVLGDTLRFQWLYNAENPGSWTCFVEVFAPEDPTIAGEPVVKSPQLTVYQEGVYQEGVSQAGDEWIWIPDDETTEMLRMRSDLLFWRVTAVSPGGERVPSDLGQLVR